MATFWWSLSGYTIWPVGPACQKKKQTKIKIGEIKIQVSSAYACVVENRFL
jgi:hypothetical protein